MGVEAQRTTFRECGPEGSYHPLEFIPFFRRFRRSVGRDLVYTFIWNCAIGSFFLVLGWAFGGGRPITAEHVLNNMVIANAVGYSIHGLFEVGGVLQLDRHAHAAGGFATVAYYTTVSSLGVVVGFLLAAVLMDVTMLEWLRRPRFLATMAFSSFVISVILAAIFLARARQAQAEAALAGERARSERIEREAAYANLRALQAQIEPHFLFNTLANVASLVDPDPAKAKHMLERFILFLRASLAATRMEITTLGAERDLIAAYLDVLQVRMGARLRYAVEIPAELASFSLPPMLLQPVVENAIRHGLEPKVDGGVMELRARREGDSVVVEIRDSGVGFAPTTRGGVGLANLRDRLRGIYGDKARLDIGENPAGGARVSLRFPA
jgi:LytS/YehU family sensor histidine kinase